MKYNNKPKNKRSRRNSLKIYKYVFSQTFGNNNQTLSKHINKINYTIFIKKWKNEKYVYIIFFLKCFALLYVKKQA